MPSFKRSFAKSLVSTVYHGALVSVSTLAIHAIVEPEEDSFEESASDLGGAVIGTAIWLGTTEKVQSVVDVVADKRAARKLVKQTEITE